MITHSEIFSQNGLSQIKVNFEKIRDDGSDFDSLTYLYPNGIVIENTGYSESEINQRADEFYRWGELAMDVEQERCEALCQT